MVINSGGGCMCLAYLRKDGILMGYVFLKMSV